MWPNHSEKTSFIISQPKQCKQNENPITDKATKKIEFCICNLAKRKPKGDCHNSKLFIVVRQ